MVLWGYCISQTCRFGIFIGLLALGYELSSETGVKAWTYHYSINPNRNWDSARDWCRQHYTDMVAIQNQREIAYLNEILPKNKYYYWIGIRKVSGVWTWVGTNKTLTEEAKNWAKGEPNNRGKKNQEDCVEIYIKRDQEAGKWNDQSCRNEKGALCYHASCREESCSTQAECVETIGNYTCKCYPGFQGLRCEEAVACGVLKAPEHGSLQCSHTYGSFRFNSSCAFRCAQGFLLVGEPRLLCQASSRWDADPPSCKAQQCEVLTAPLHGSLHCSHPHEEFSFNSSCNVRCEEGFLLNGTASIQCTSLGVWTEPPPLCQAKQCDVLTAPLHGSLHCSHPHEEFSFNSSCNVSCEEGFLLNGTASIQCTSLGVWTEPPTLCQAQQCDVLTAPLHGSLHCYHPHVEFSFNSSCNVSCEEGFLLNGTASIQCTSLGVWTEPPPLCQAQQCDVLTAPLYGSLHCSHPHEEFSFNSSCNVRCEEGFLLNGTASIQCTSLGVWTEPSPLCQARQCLPLVAPGRGQMNCSHPHSLFSFGSSCELGCEEGFVLRGAPTLQCTESGFWSHTAPSCQAQRCNVLTAPLHGSLHCSHPHEEFSFNSSCNVRCEEGFLLNGTASIQCTSAGVWTEPSPLCQAQQCDVLTAPLHGSLHCYHPHEEFSFNSSCNVSCEEGFLLNGTASIQCTSLGVWTELPPLCQAQQCEVLTAPLHGSLHCSHPHEEFSFNSSCNVSCEEGFLLNGTASIQCTSLGVWTEPPPLCQARQCLPLVAPGRGQMNCSHPHSLFSFGSSCELGCEEGFVLRGAPTLQCTESGLWSHTAPSCQAQQCEVLTAPLHGSLHCYHPHEEFSFNSSCNVSCEEGFLLNGTASIQCTSLGAWTEPPPFCQARQCLPLVAPGRGQMNCSHPHSLFSFGSSCELGCEEGFVLRGAPTLQCTEFGLWSHTAPSCQAQRCNVLTAPLHGSLHCSHPHEEFSFNSSCNVSCEEGFLLNGTASIQCTSAGVWTEPPPLCQVVQCQALGDLLPPFLSMKCSNPLGIFSFRSQCFFHCGNGSSLNGTSKLSCASNGTWNAPRPSCTEPEMTFGTGLLISAGVGFASAVSLLLLGGLVFLIASHLSKRAHKYHLKTRDFAVLGELENPAYEEG
ncbi:E-selectin-like isoform X6 [Anguilla rostrata]|uniref:E-selectin-like isoform X6 n=1 Tax=Anguilla rostrata TaxID=7938 RepID=UPI0030CB040A